VNPSGPGSGETLSNACAAGEKRADGILLSGKGAFVVGSVMTVVDTMEEKIAVAEGLGHGSLFGASRCGAQPGSL